MTDRPDLVIDGDGHVIEVDATYERIDPSTASDVPATRRRAAATSCV